jgi:uncharacterized protein involved in outer membrane biogenesis
VLRRVLVSQASQLLKARVELGDLDLHLLRGVVVLKDFAIFENHNAPLTGAGNSGASPTPASAAGGPSKESAVTATRPIIAWKSLAFDVHWLPLARRTLQLGAIVLDSPRISLDRLQSGHLNMGDLVRAALGPPAQTSETPTATAAAPTPAPAEATAAPGTEAPGSPPAQSTPVVIPDRTPQPEEGAATSGWRIGTDRLEVRDGGIHFRDLMLKGSEPVDLAIPTIQVADIGLSPDVYGKPVDFHLRAAVDQGSLDLAARAQLSGDNVSLDCGLKAQGLPLRRSRLYIPKVGWSDLRGELDTDLSYRLETGTTNEVRGTLTLRDLSVTVPELPEAALSWKSLSVRFDPLDVSVDVDVADLSGVNDNVAKIKLALGLASGSVHVDGKARIAPPGFGGALKVTALSLPEVIATCGALAQNPIQSATLDADLSSAASGVDTRGDAGDIRMQGDLSIVKPRLALDDGKEFLVSLGALDLGIADMRVPGALAARPAGPAEPLRIALRDLKLDAPSIRLTHTKDGFVLPGTSEPANASPQTAVVAGAAPRDAAAAIDVSLGSIRINNGRLAVTDRRLTPAFSTALIDIALAARDIQVPELTAKQVRFSVTTPVEGEIKLSGDVASGAGALQLDARDVALTPYSPYAAAFSPYAIDSGSLQLSTQVKREEQRYDATNEITLQDFEVGPGQGQQSWFEQQFGIPLSMGLALLRDPEGNITLNVPVHISEQGTKVDVGAVAGSALRDALVGALTSPLRLVGSLGAGDNLRSFVPAPVTFHPGRAELTADGAKSLDRMAAFLTSRPAMGVELQAVVTQADQRWLHEQALLQSWQEQGFLGRLRTLTQRGTRDRVEAALQARAKDENGELSADDAQALDQWLKAIPAPSAQQLQGLAAARLDKAAATLRQAKGMDDSRLAVVEPSAQLAEGAPEVQIQLKPLKRRHAAAAGSDLPSYGHRFTIPTRNPGVRTSGVGCRIA